MAWLQEELCIWAEVSNGKFVRRGKDKQKCSQNCKVLGKAVDVVALPSTDRAKRKVMTHKDVNGVVIQICVL